jgi:hypothetical protein
MEEINQIWWPNSLRFQKRPSWLPIIYISYGCTECKVQ